jgi:hypothetical protein
VRLTNTVKSSSSSKRNKNTSLFLSRALKSPNIIMRRSRHLRITPKNIQHSNRIKIKINLRAIRSMIESSRIIKSTFLRTILALKRKNRIENQKRCSTILKLIKKLKIEVVQRLNQRIVNSLVAVDRAVHILEVPALTNNHLQNSHSK